MSNQDAVGEASKDPYAGRDPMTDREWRAWASCVSPGGAHTLSKRPDRYGEGTPAAVQRGSGVFAWDRAGQRYIDFTSGLAAVTLGHGHPAVVAAIRRSAGDGGVFGIPHVSEPEVGAQFLKATGWPDGMVRWVSTGSEATEAAVRTARMATGRDLILSIGYHCFSPDTELLTIEGFRRVGVIRKGELLATLNPGTDALEYRPVVETMTQAFNGEMVHFKGHRVDLLVTPNHRIYRRYQDSRGRSDFRFEEAGKAVGRANRFMLAGVGRWDGSTPAEIIIPSESAPMIGRAFPSEAFCRFVGHFVTEGHAQKRRDRQGYEVFLSQKPGPKREAMRAVLQTLGFEPWEDAKSLGFCSRDLWLWLQNCGHGTQAKCIPRAIKGLGAPLLQGLFDAMIDGDGTRDARGNPRKFYTTSRQLVDDFCEIALKLGYSTTVTWRVNRGGNIAGKAVRLRQPIAFISLARPRVRRVVREQIDRVPYRGDVHCVTVPPYSLVYARRNGRSVWCGNSWHSTFTAAKPVRPGVPAAFASVIRDLPAGQIDAVREALDATVAALILEPCADGPPDAVYLQAVVDLAHRHGALVIADEIIAGFRWSEQGAMLGTCGVRPDLACYGKAIANGAFPIAALVGPPEIMQHAWPVSGTANGHPLGLAAVAAVLGVYRREQPIMALKQAGRALRHGLAGLAATGPHAYLWVGGDDPRPVARIMTGNATRDNVGQTLLCQELARRGVLWHPAGAGNAMAGHGPYVAETLDAFAGALAVVAQALASDHPETWLMGAPSSRAVAVR